MAPSEACERLSMHVRLLYILCLGLLVLQVSSVLLTFHWLNRGACLDDVDGTTSSSVSLRTLWHSNESSTTTSSSSTPSKPRGPPPTSVLRRDERSVRDSALIDWDEEEGSDDQHQHQRTRHHRRSRHSGRDHVHSKTSGYFQHYNNEEDKPWVPVTSRISTQELAKFCRESCPEGPPGPKGHPGIPGFPGLKGEKGDYGQKGDLGFPGKEGRTGTAGYPGLPGVKGEPGEPGENGDSGVDGRNGLPGTPGLDGIPGRDGIDGIPGRDGIPGTPGLPGRHGTNGTHGIPGTRGPQGPRGPAGSAGLPGPHGKRGTPGKDGEPGTPGTSTWTFGNGSTILVPPQILDKSWNYLVSVKEKGHLRLRCPTSGSPPPHVMWRRKDGQLIPNGQWEDAVITGALLNLTYVHRRHLGDYLCIANNGIGTEAIQQVTIEVHFAPFIKISNDEPAAKNGSSAVMECVVEAFPEPMRYWIGPDGRILDHGTKYTTTTNVMNNYTATIILKINNVTQHDFGQYKCVARNPMGTQQGNLTLYDEMDPAYRLRIRLGSKTKTYGEEPPELTGYEQLCPIQLKPCEECQTPSPREKCVDPSKLQAKSYPIQNDTFDHFPEAPPISNCILMEIGKPVFERAQSVLYGAWMHDPSSPNADSYWVTLGNQSNILYEYKGRKNFREDSPFRQYKLKHDFMGNGHIIYNGSFYYHMARKVNATDLVGSKPHTLQTIVRYDLSKSPEDSNSYKTHNVAYATTTLGRFVYSNGPNYMDFEADENGIWVIYGQDISNFTTVMKYRPDTLQPEFRWNISVNHRLFADMFIICGILYGVEDGTSKSTPIRFAFDLYNNEMADFVGTEFTNPFRMNTMISYDHRNKSLLSWDKGNLLVYPIKLNSRNITVMSTKGDGQ